MEADDSEVFCRTRVRGEYALDDTWAALVGIQEVYKEYG